LSETFHGHQCICWTPALASFSMHWLLYQKIYISALFSTYIETLFHIQFTNTNKPQPVPE